MAKFYKPGRLVIVTNGRYAGKKGIIVRGNVEQTKTKKYSHCLVLGLKKSPRRVTKKSLKKIEEKLKSFETKVNDTKNGRNAKKVLERMKKFGVFVKTYNTQHILATRYKVSDNFGIDSQMEKIDNIENQIKDTQTKINTNKDNEKKAEETKNLQTQLGELRNQWKNTLNECKVNVGKELYNRYMRGFIKTKDNVEENEKIASSEFLFTKLKF